MKIYTFYCPQTKQELKVVASSLAEAFRECPKAYAWAIINVQTYIGQGVR
jgi:hypothetical protein